MKNTFTKFCSSVIIACLILPSCASIVTKTSYPISVNSSPQDVEFTIKNKKGEEVMKSITPATIKLDASTKYMSGERYELTFKHPDYKEKTVYIHSSIEGWYWANILLGGLIGMLVVDPLTGAMYKLDTTPINVSLTQSKGETKPSEAELTLVDINTLSEEMKEKLIKISE